MLRFIVLCVLVKVVFSGDSKVVFLDEGAVQGEKYWNGDFYEFYGIPYATVPKGEDRFQGPLPAEPWSGLMTANVRSMRCFQAYLGTDDEEPLVDGEEDCLHINLLVPKIANETNLVPVVAYVHSGAFSGGNGNMGQYHYLARHDIIVISFNYRLGALGFACLGNKEVPGNAGLKDQVAALRWINKNIAKFGGDPKKVTVAGFSVGAAMAELLALSDTTNGLIDKIILESGSALSPFAVNRDPVSTAKNTAIALGYKDTGSLRDLTEFYLSTSFKALASKGHNFFLSNSTFGFSPCIENVHEGIEAFLTESPIDIIKKGKNKQVAILTGFANMEGLSRSVKFAKWSEKMNEKFDDFLPADLLFKDDESKANFIKQVMDLYFKGEEVTHDTLQGYVDYFSDSMFKYSILKSAKEHVAKTKRPVYFYEFSYVGELSMKHYFMDRIKGASHRDQTAYILDFFGWTNKHSDLDTRDRMTMMWADFVKYEDPTAYESALVDFKWHKFNNKEPNYLQIGNEVSMSKGIFEDGFKFWNDVYEKHYWNPKAPEIVIEEPKTAKDDTEVKRDKVDEEPDKSDPKLAEEKSKPKHESETEINSKNKPINEKVLKESETDTNKAPAKTDDFKTDKKPETIYVNDPRKSREKKVVTEPEQPEPKKEKSNTEL